MFNECLCSLNMFYFNFDVQQVEIDVQQVEVDVQQVEVDVEQVEDDMDCGCGSTKKENHD